MTPKEEIEQQIKIAEEAIEKARGIAKENGEEFTIDVDGFFNVSYRPRWNDVYHHQMYGEGWESSTC